MSSRLPHLSARRVPPAAAIARSSRPVPPFSLEAYMADETTRVFNYNGRKLVSILGREEFPGERSFKLPTKAVEFASRQPLTSALLPCRIGFFPKASGQKVSRPSGDWAFTLLFCLDGTGMLDLADSRHRMGRGTFALLRPFEFHAYAADAHQPWSYYWIHFNGAMAQQYYDVVTGSGKRACIEVEPDLKFVQAFETILSLYHQGHAYKMLVQASATMHLLLADLYGLACKRACAPESVAARIDRTLEVMRNNPGLQVSIHEFAAMANMSAAYFARQFRRRTGETPRSFFNRLKITKACEYLTTTTTKVESIAHLLGYADPFYFCRLFKGTTGKSPTRYRQEALKRSSGAAA